MAYLEGFEPPTFWSVARRSIQLSYRYALISKTDIRYRNNPISQIGMPQKNDFCTKIAAYIHIFTMKYWTSVLENITIQLYFRYLF